MSRLKRVAAGHYGLTQILIVVAAVDSYELLRRAIPPDWPLALRHAREVTGWEPQLTLEEGIRQTLEWYRRHPEARAPAPA